MDDRGKAQASVCYAGQYQRHAVNGTPIKTYNTTSQQALLIGFEVDLRQTPAGHGATCPDGKIMSESGIAINSRTYLMGLSNPMYSR
jgi:hypothetical protein